MIGITQSREKYYLIIQNRVQLQLKLQLLEIDPLSTNRLPHRQSSAPYIIQTFLHH